MKCFYCDSEMILSHGFYECMQINGKFGHSFELNHNLNDKEFRFFIDKTKVECEYEHFDDYGNYAAEFHSIAYDYHNNWDNSFLLEDFNILKEIKNKEQLQLLIDKLKVFK